LNGYINEYMDGQTNCIDGLDKWLDAWIENTLMDKWTGECINEYTDHGYINKWINWWLN
jgi:hypothetical protein